MDNALRYAPRGSAVTVSLRQAAQSAVIRVEDAGSGIPPAERERVLERFHAHPGEEPPGLAVQVWLPLG